MVRPPAREGAVFLREGKMEQGEKPEMKPAKWVEIRRQIRVTEAERKSDNAMLTKNRDRGEMRWRHREMGVSERA